MEAMAQRRKFISVEECAKCNNEIKDDLRTIKNALIGENMRGGIVNQITNLENKISDIAAARACDEKEMEKKDDVKVRWKLATVGALVALAMFVAGRLLDFFL